LWASPRNPRGEWGSGALGLTDPLHAHVVYARVRASHQTPTHGRRNYTTMESYPATAIIDGLIDLGTPGQGTFWGNGPDETVRGPGLLLPGPGLAHVWDKLAGVPNVEVVVHYLLTGKDGAHSHAEILLAARYSDRAKTDYMYRDHNSQLFGQAPPLTWREGKQYGDEKEEAPVVLVHKSSHQRKRRAHTHRDTPL